VRNGKLNPNPDTNFILMPEDLVAIIGDEKNRQALTEVKTSSQSQYMYRKQGLNQDQNSSLFPSES